jgi:hypothetical protein
MELYAYPAHAGVSMDQLWQRLSDPRRRLWRMANYDPKADLQLYLQRARESLVWKLDGLSDYDIRRPLTPTGTNLLGLVKHVAGVEAGYLGVTFGRPFPEPLPWYDDEAEDNADMWATPDESRDDLIALYRRVWAHSSETVEALPLDAVGHVPHWPAPQNEVTLHRILVHVTAEVAQHAGHADVVREHLDGAAGLRADRSSLPSGQYDWPAHVAKVQAAADRFA